MSRVISTSQLQQQIGKLVTYIANSFVIVTNRGKAKMVMLPYFEDNDQAIADYLEEYEMRKNASALEKRWAASLESGISDLVV